VCGCVRAIRRGEREKGLCGQILASDCPPVPRYGKKISEMRKEREKIRGRKRWVRDDQSARQTWQWEAVAVLPIEELLLSPDFIYGVRMNKKNVIDDVQQSKQVVGRGRLGESARKRNRPIEKTRRRNTQRDEKWEAQPLKQGGISTEIELANNRDIKPERASDILFHHQNTSEPQNSGSTHDEGEERVIEVLEWETGGRQNILFQRSKKLLSSGGPFKGGSLGWPT